MGQGRQSPSLRWGLGTEEAVPAASAPFGTEKSVAAPSLPALRQGRQSVAFASRLMGSARIRQKAVRHYDSLNERTRFLALEVKVTPIPGQMGLPRIRRMRE